KYLPRFLACETRDIPLPGNKRIERLLFCGGVSFFPTVSGTIFFYQKSFLIESFHQNVAAIQK
ncbi:hypothetical protein SEEH3343_13851, partial [Salmonella enterica subsp. enterica serovar Heidelberg str. RI-11-013343]